MNHQPPTGPAGYNNAPPPNAHMQPPQGPQGQQPQGPPPTLGLPPQGPPQLPPQMFTTAASLLDLTDKKLLVTLRDGRKVIGVLRSWDQFGNLVLQQTVERTFAGHLYADAPRGIYLVRGENVTLMGEIDLDKDDVVPAPFQKGSEEEVFRLRRAEEKERDRREKIRSKRLRELGFEGLGKGEEIVL